MKLSYHWSGSVDFPEYNQIMSTPTVGDISGDGIPEIAFITFKDGDRYYRGEGVLRVLDGETKKEIFSVGDDLAPKVSTPLLIDIDGDGFGEIIYPHKDNRSVVALNHDGTLRWKVTETNGEGWGGASAFDFNEDGQSEIIIRGLVLFESKDSDGSYIIEKISFGEKDYRGGDPFAHTL
ncbi:VCBS repeat-containing protein, partial [Bdellovibrionales bacterium]|nr:VCBS repeat-containing protein [Bdellovibrionales bacterium]